MDADDLSKTSKVRPLSNVLHILLFLLVVKYSLFLTIIRLLWLFGLTLCGPLRTILLYEHSDIVILACFTSLFSTAQQKNTSRIRGTVFLLLAVLAIFAFDNDDVRQRVLDHPEGYLHHQIFSHLFYRLTSLIGVADHKGGVILLLIALLLRCAINNLNRELVLDIGGPKRFYALTTCISTIFLAPLSLVVLITSKIVPSSITTVVNDVTTSTNSLSDYSTDLFSSYIIPIVLISIFLFVFDFYCEQISVTKLDKPRTYSYSTYTMILSGLVISLFWSGNISRSTINLTSTELGQQTGEHALSGGVIFAIIMLLFSTDLLSYPLQTRSGAFIGYSSIGKPLFHAVERSSSHSFIMVLKSGLREILAQSDSRRIFYFLCINLMFTFVELLYGAWTNSLGLISDGFHMLFDCTALVMGLYASLMSRWKPTRVFSYGYGRVEVLSGFVNGLFLVVVAFFVFYEAIGRIFEPPTINTDRLLAVAVAGFAVNMIGLFSFSHAHSHGGGSSHSHGGGSSHSHAGDSSHSHGGGSSHSHNNSHDHSHSHGHDHGHSHTETSHGHSHSLTNNANMKGVFLHVLADTLGSVGVIISSLLIQYFGWYISDPLCSLFISIMIFLSVLPLLKDSAMTLLLETPPDIQIALDKILRIENVQSFSNEHFWALSSSQLIGTIHIQIAKDGDEQRITSQVQAILKENQVTNIAIQIEKQVFFNHLQGLNSALGQLSYSQRTFSSN
ncbi:unnamed protein product [Didymodactylos carnosus]|uniref:Proton-coupled zinc antiporter SLC30A5 n=1 Tax=Didymodactylos carnosus TaxID=1234261 RepID=A0A814QQA5_9BILA|nr:unnamed protein product [Didymodactylos carnosus]CAF1404457.1 unnamed protein product [Didymodactylos carnosus]CAF3886698.1 unnamed protein product [Didymodactylos carnosus]CAF4210568.1 unnamed protein product [Didymodactylos carnosus]